MCEIEGTQLSTEKGGSVRVFPQYQMEEFQLRTPQRVVQQAKDALTTNEIVCGVRGLSVLKMLPLFDIVWNVPFDSMHGVYQGTQKQLLCLWFDSSSHIHEWYLGPRVLTIDKILLSFKPPSEVSRLPRSINKDRAYFKANEAKNSSVLWTSTFERFPP